MEEVEKGVEKVEGRSEKNGETDYHRCTPAGAPHPSSLDLVCCGNMEKLS